MLKKLQLKFVLIVMTIVTIMMSVIFCLLYYTTGTALERESFQMMAGLSSNPMRMGAPNNNVEEGIRLPYLTLIVNRTGEVTEIGGGFFDLSDESLVDDLLQRTQEAKTPTGVLKDYNLRFLKTENKFGTTVIFADMTSEQSTLNNMIKNFLITGSFAFFMFLVISILLSRWAVRPVEKAWK